MHGKLPNGSTIFHENENTEKLKYYIYFDSWESDIVDWRNNAWNFRNNFLDKISYFGKENLISSITVHFSII